MECDQRQRRSEHEEEEEVEEEEQKKSEVASDVWKACAGSLIEVPKVNSRVYYFPQGHIEQASDTVYLSSRTVMSKPCVMCRVAKVSYFADSDTEEVFVKFTLHPLTSVSNGSNNVGIFVDANANANANANAVDVDGDVNGAGGGGEVEGGVSWYAKVLTQSDANNGGGFSVPRFCADSIFPPLNFDDDPPVQTLWLIDAHGERWKFRHIYRGTPRRHLLTTGWSTFVNGKNLVARDSVVFIKRNPTKELFVGVRRKYQSPELATWGILQRPQGNEGGDGSGGNRRRRRGGGGGEGGFSRAKRGRVPPEDVSEAIDRAVNEMPFEAVYYPRPGMPEFVVAAEKVEAACGVYWTDGMRVKIAQETDDGARFTWYNGTIASVGSGRDHAHWRLSPWRMLEVSWDEPEILQNMKTVNPWQVEFISPTPPIPAAFPPAKKLRGVQNPGLLPDQEGNLSFSSVGFSSRMSQLNSSFLNFNNFPAGMQGARQNPFYISSLPTIMNGGTRGGYHDDSFSQMVEAGVGSRDDQLNSSQMVEAGVGNCDDQLNKSSQKVEAGVGNRDDQVKSSLQKVGAVSTDLIIGSSPPETPSADSQSSVYSGTPPDTEQDPCKSTRKPVTSFQLFGKVIHMEQPLTNGDDKKCTENVDNTTEGKKNTVDKSLMDLPKVR